MLRRSGRAGDRAGAPRGSSAWMSPTSTCPASAAASSLRAGTTDWVHWQTGTAMHSLLTHEAEDGTITRMLLARSRHASVRSLERYARPGPEAVARHVARRPGRAAPPARTLSVLPAGCVTSP